MNIRNNSLLNKNNQQYSSHMPNSNKSNKSLQYVQDQQPSFHNKYQEQFTVFDQLTLNDKQNIKSSPNIRYQNTVISPIKPNHNKHFLNRHNQDDLQTYNKKYIFLKQSLDQLRFLHEVINTKIIQQKRYFQNFVMGEVKKCIFTMNIHYEKEKIQFMKLQRNINTSYSQKQTHKMILGQDSNQDTSTQLSILKRQNEDLKKQKNEMKQKFQKSLKLYQEQIQNLATTIIQHQKYKQQQAYQNQLRNRRRQKSSQQNFQIESYKTYLKDQKQKHKKAMLQLEEKVFMIQSDFQALAAQKNYIQTKYKERQKQIDLKQSQLQYKRRQLDQKQRDIEMAEKMIERQKIQIDRKAQRISDYQTKVLRQERKIKQINKEKQIVASQYYTQSQKHKIILEKNGNTRGNIFSRFIERDNKDNQSQTGRSSSRNSKADINARLKQIAEMKRSRGSQGKIGSYNSFRSSNISDRQASNKLTNSRQKSHNRGQYTTRLAPQSGRKHIEFSSSQTTRRQYPAVNLSQKMDSLTQNLQRQLRQIK